MSACAPSADHAAIAQPVQPGRGSGEHVDGPLERQQPVLADGLVEEARRVAEGSDHVEVGPGVGRPDHRPRGRSRPAAAPASRRLSVPGCSRVKVVRNPSAMTMSTSASNGSLPSSSAMSTDPATGVGRGCGRERLDDDVVAATWRGGACSSCPRPARPGAPAGPGR